MLSSTNSSSSSTTMSLPLAGSTIASSDGADAGGSARAAASGTKTLNRVPLPGCETSSIG